MTNLMVLEALSIGQGSPNVNGTLLMLHNARFEGFLQGCLVRIVVFVVNFPSDNTSNSTGNSGKSIARRVVVVVRRYAALVLIQAGSDPLTELLPVLGFWRFGCGQVSPTLWS